MRRGVVRRSEFESTRGGGRTQAASRNGTGGRMSAWLRAAIFTLAAMLWLSGIVWLALHFLVRQQTPFGPLPNPWEPVLMRIHGASAIGVVFFLGWIGAEHVIGRWGKGRLRLSGVLLASSAALLAVTGYALYYSVGEIHDVAALIHDWIGAFTIVIALVHWRRVRAR